MMKNFRLFLTVMVCSLVLWGSGAGAHEFIVKPDAMGVRPGEEISFSVISAHVFMVSEEMEPKDKVTVNLVNGEAATPVTLQPNPGRMTLDGIAKCRNSGYSILSGHRLGMVWTKTTKGWKQGPKKDLEGVVSESKKYEKFCKALIRAGKADQGYGRVLGHGLEIVPMEDPGACRVNTEMAVKILCQGNPLSAEVRATYDRFSSHPNSYAYVTQSDEQGIAQVKITHAGTWMVRVETRLKQPAEDYDVHVMRAVLVFEVK